MITPFEAFQNWRKSIEKENYTPPDDSHIPEEDIPHNIDKEAIVTVIDSKNWEQFNFKIECEPLTNSINVKSLDTEEDLSFSMEEYDEEKFNVLFSNLVENFKK